MTDRSHFSLSGIISMFTTAFPDMDFLSPRGELSIKLESHEFSRVRIELPSTEFLHLHSVEIISSSGDDLTTGATLWASSSWKSSDERIAGDLLFNPKGSHRKAFHTDRDDGPWVELVLPRLVVADQITLRNADEKTADRARNIKVSIHHIGSHSLTVYDGAEREKQVADLATGIIENTPDLTCNDRKLIELVRDLVACRYTTAKAQLKSIAESESLSHADIRTCVSDLLLSRRQLEWTSHGVRRSFRFWTYKEKVRYISAAKKIVNDLQFLSPVACFGFGSALAVARDGELIPHDDDIDLILGLESHQAGTLPEGLELVRRHLTELGYRVRGDFISHFWVTKGSEYKIDVFVGVFEGDQIAWYPGKRASARADVLMPVSSGRLLGTHRDDLLPLSTGRLLGIDCPLPRNPQIYLETVYGPSWRTPDAGFKHAWLPRVNE